MLGREDISLTMREADGFPQLGPQIKGSLPESVESRLQSIRAPRREDEFDAVYRISYPYDFGPSRCERTFVFATCERMILKNHQWFYTGRPFAEVIKRNNIKIITPSRWSKNGFIRSGADANDITIVPHGFDPTVFKPLSEQDRDAARKSKGLEGKFVFLSVGAMTGNKNPGVILTSFLTVAREHDNAVLLLKGLNDIYASHYWIARELANFTKQDAAFIRSRMMYVGETITIAEQAMLYQVADVYVAPYQSEGFNIPVLEAMACGLPVIVTDGGATDDFTTDDFALRVKAELGDHQHNKEMYFMIDQNSLIEQMFRAIKDDGFMTPARCLAEQHAHENYTWAKVTDQLIDTLKGKA